MKTTIPPWKIAATVGGVALVGNATALNAQHIAASEGWASPLLFASIVVTICAAGTPPLAERAAKEGQPLKAVLLWTFFALALGFSLSSSISRSSSYATGRVATATKSNETYRLAKEAYQAAQEARTAECRKRGPLCRGAEAAVSAARERLLSAAPVAATDPGAERLAAVLGVQEASVQLYGPLLLPLGVELGGFIFLALGLAPRRREKDVGSADPLPKIPQPIAIAPSAKPNVVAKAAKPIAKSSGSREYYRTRLARDFPEIANRVANGEISVYRASVEAGLRKAAAKRKWDANDYAKVTA